MSGFTYEPPGGGKPDWYTPKWIVTPFLPPRGCDRKVNMITVSGNYKGLMFRLNIESEFDVEGAVAGVIRAHERLKDGLNTESVRLGKPDNT